MIRTNMGGNDFFINGNNKVINLKNFPHFAKTYSFGEEMYDCFYEWKIKHNTSNQKIYFKLFDFGEKKVHQR